jgi:flagellar biosynthesis anti-sigma factor FlgM
MKIESNRPDPAAVEKATTTPIDKSTTGTTAAPGASADKVALSQDAELFAKASKAATAEPQVRQELVDKMKQTIATNGGLDVDPGELADRMIDDLLDK